MGKITRSVVTYECDRCGSTEDTTYSKARSEWGSLDLAYRGVTGSRTWEGSGAESRHEGRVWLCLNCTKDFLTFIEKKKF